MSIPVDSSEFLMIGLIIFTPCLLFDELGIKTMKKLFEFPYFRFGDTSWYPLLSVYISFAIVIGTYPIKLRSLETDIFPGR